MTTRLPIPGSDSGSWGDILNAYLSVAHNADGTLKSDIFFEPKNYGAITDGGSFGDGLAHPASANGYSSLSDLQAVHAFATALSDDMAGLMIQAAINDAHTKRDGIIYLPAGQYRNLPGGLIFPANTNARLLGAGSRNSILLCANCGTNPGITINQQQPGNGPVANITLQGMNSIIYPSQSANGVAQTRIYNAGSVGIFFKQNSFVTYEGISLYNFDLCTDWDSTTGGNYGLTFRGCVFYNSNKGFVIRQSCPNSFEKMCLDGCLMAGNNYGAYIIFQTSATQGAGSAIAADAYFINCSLDYNTVNQIYYLGLGSATDHLNSVYLACCHLETSTTISGSAICRIQHDGNMDFSQCEWFEAAGNGLGAVFPMSQFARTWVAGGKGPGIANSDTDNMPFIVIGVSNNSVAFGGSGLSDRNATNAVLFSSFQGMLTANTFFDPRWSTISGNFTLSLPYQNSPLLVSTTCNVTVPPQSTSNFLVGTRLTLTAYPGATATLVAGGGVTINSTGVGLTFGGANGATIFLTKTGADTWSATGEMN